MSCQNCILVTIDCLRGDQPGFMGCTPSITPTLDRLAAEGLLCRHAFACGPRTAESFPAILTSTYPLMYNIDGHHLSSRRIPIAKVLKEQGFSTAAFHSTPVLSGQYNYDVGFDHFWDSLQNADPTFRHGLGLAKRLHHLGWTYELMRKAYHASEVLRNKPPFLRAEAILGRAQRWLQERDRTKRAFLWIHLMDLHNPYLPLRRYQVKFLPRPLSRWRMFNLSMRMMDQPEKLSEEDVATLHLLYRAQLSYVDAQLASFVESLEQDSLSDDTLVVVTADHGEEFGEHGGVGHAAFVHQVRDERVAVKLYDELLHVPLFFRAPSGCLRSSTVTDIVSLIDVSPTIIELLGLPPVPQWQGQSLVPMIDGAVDPSAKGVFAEYEVQGLDGRAGPVVSYRTRDWKYIHDALFGRHELYDLRRDPDEQHNVAGLYPHVAMEMRPIVEKHLASMEPHSATPDIAGPVDEEVLRRLKHLGYLS